MESLHYENEKEMISVLQVWQQLSKHCISAHKLSLLTYFCTPNNVKDFRLLEFTNFVAVCCVWLSKPSNFNVSQYQTHFKLLADKSVVLSSSSNQSSSKWISENFNSVEELIYFAEEKRKALLWDILSMVKIIITLRYKKFFLKYTNDEYDHFLCVFGPWIWM